MNNENLKPFKKGVKHNYDSEKMQAKRALKDLLKGFSEDKFEDFVTEFDKLRGKPKCDIYIQILQYVQPKYAAIQFEDFKEVKNAVELLKAMSAYNKNN